jgi:hypothetical protein
MTDALTTQPEKRRRLDRVVAACDLCKRRKVKCDGVSSAPGLEAFCEGSDDPSDLRGFAHSFPQDLQMRINELD